MLTRTLDRILINREYARLWYGQAISSVGDYVFSTTLVLWVASVLAKGQPWGPAAVSGVLIAVGAAVLVVGPFAGVFVDRWDPLRTMLGTEVIRGAAVLLLTAVSVLPVGALPVWAWLTMIYLVVFLLNATGQFFLPARLSVIREIVTGEADRARAAGIAQATAGTAAIVGPPLAAPLLFAVGMQWALLLNAASYAVSYVAIRSARLDTRGERGAPDRPRANLLAEYTAGLRVFAGSRFLIALLTLSVIGQLGMGALNTLNVFFLTGNLHAPSHLYGYLGTAMGVGGIIGALCAGMVVQRIGARGTTWAGLIAGGALLLAYSQQTGFLAGLAVLFLFMVPITMLNTAMTPLLLAAAPKEYTGRVIAVFYPVTRLSSMLAAMAAGWLASSALRDFSGSVAGVAFGPIDTILAAAGLLIVISGVYARLALPASSDEPAPAATAPEPGGR
ncbi:MFS family permease [Thermocatellispora tengchongensis]|uniref:MFS family permease n=1 Tax=Thermocatellispora tengchongensis TaxID=1073253 RepID=A0A840PF21_9ACTN|nr:MFS transporter [Thermocatellispora tengchongensis]MBB5134635.1 MFS family permease [Thermocatellispora tengchongensis]